MGERTGIEWTQATWNPVTGCTKISAGCAHCYAERDFHRPYPERKFTDVQCHPDRLEIPLHWRKPRRIFLCSMGDLFHEAVPFGFVMRCLSTMAVPWHTYQILTKRPERMRDFFSCWGDLTGEDWEVKLARGPEETRKAHPSRRGQLFADMLESMGDPPNGCGYPTFDWMHGMITWPAVIRNLWLGVSVENQETADERIPLLLQTPAAVRFVSYEPALGPIKLKTEWLYYGAGPAFTLPRGSGKLSWMIAGGESGPKARPSHPDWFRSVRDQCQAAGVPFFFKQWGEWAPSVESWSKFCEKRVDGSLDWEKGQHMVFESGQAMWRSGKKAAGRLLDGREWNEFPSSHNANRA